MTTQGGPDPTGIGQQNKKTKNILNNHKVLKTIVKFQLNKFKTASHFYL